MLGWWSPVYSLMIPIWSFNLNDVVVTTVIYGEGRPVRNYQWYLFNPGILAGPTAVKAAGDRYCDRDQSVMMNWATSPVYDWWWKAAHLMEEGPITSDEWMMTGKFCWPCDDIDRYYICYLTELPAPVFVVVIGSGNYIWADIIIRWPVFDGRPDTTFPINWRQPSVITDDNFDTWLMSDTRWPVFDTLTHLISVMTYCWCWRHLLWPIDDIPTLLFIVFLLIDDILTLMIYSRWRWHSVVDDTMMVLTFTRPVLTLTVVLWPVLCVLWPIGVPWPHDDIAIWPVLLAGIDIVVVVIICWWTTTFVLFCWYCWWVFRICLYLHYLLILYLHLFCYLTICYLRTLWYWWALPFIWCWYVICCWCWPSSTTICALMTLTWLTIQFGDPIVTTDRWHTCCCCCCLLLAMLFV